jgi:hypothetical protein
MVIHLDQHARFRIEPAAEMREEEVIKGWLAGGAIFGFCREKIQDSMYLPTPECSVR